MPREVPCRAERPGSSTPGPQSDMRADDGQSEGIGSRAELRGGPLSSEVLAAHEASESQVSKRNLWRLLESVTDHLPL